jgi:hypothetical protein
MVDPTRARKPNAEKGVGVDAGDGVGREIMLS